MADILVLFERAKKPSSRNYLGFIDVMKEHTSFRNNVSYTGSALSHLSFLVTDNRAVIRLEDGRDLKTFDGAYFKSWQKDIEAAYATALYLADNNVPFIDSEPLHQASYTKLTETLLLARAGLQVPDTLISRDRDMIDDFLKAHGGVVVVKNAAAQKGKDNHLCRSLDDILAIVKGTRRRYLIQEYIPNDGDYRFTVYGTTVGFILKRQSQSGSHIHNFSNGGTETAVPLNEWTDEQLEAVIRAGMTLQREVAGIDVMLHKDTNKMYFLEVNYSPQILSGDYEADMVRPLVDHLVHKNKLIDN